MKNIKKLLSVALAFIMILSCMSTAFAASVERCPVIVIPGIATSTIYSDVNDPSTEIEFPTIEDLKIKVEREIAPALIVYAADKDVDKLAGVFSDFFNYIFEDWFNNPDGTPIGNSGSIVTYPAASSITEKSVLRFEWDWRGDPFEVVKELARFVDYVRESSGCDKVAFASHSLGSVIILTYLSLYGDSKVSGIVYDTPVIDGVNYVGELLLGNMETDGDALVYGISGLFSGSEDADFAESILDVLTLAGLPAELSVLFNSVIDDMAPVLYRDTLVPLFGRWLTIWAMTPAEDVDAAMDYIFTKYLTDEASMELKGKIEKYNTLVRKDRYQTLLDFDKEGRMAVISRYGFSSLPITERWSDIGDTVVETRSSSIGATTAAYGDIFDAAYLEGKADKYISPDKTVDASTCLFPEKTWFVKSLNHGDVTLTQPYYAALLFGEKEATCDSFELSRFVAYDAESNSIVKDESQPEKLEKKSPFEVLWGFLKSFFEKLFSFFKK